MWFYQRRGKLHVAVAAYEVSDCIKYEAWEGKAEGKATGEQFNER